MRIKFWGTRGSIPTPEPDFMRYGGDTPCVEIRSDDTLLILDAGTGIRKLGAELMRDSDFSGKGYIFLSHSHWDHIQGFPFFNPAFVSGNEFYIYGALKADKRLTEALKGQMSSIYFPVNMVDLPSSLHFNEIIEQDVMIGDLIIRSRALNHPGGCLGYRISNGKHSIAYCTDTEPLGNGEIDKKVIELASNADLFICDAQFTPEEYKQGRKGWGHSTWYDCVKLAKAAGVSECILFHHDPYHNDEFIDGLVYEAKSHFPRVSAAQRNMEIDFTPSYTYSRSEIKSKTETQSRPKTTNLSVIETKTRANNCIVHLPRDLSIFNSSSFQNKVLELLEHCDCPRVILNLSDLSYIDSSGVGSLVSIKEDCSRRGIVLDLCSVSKRILEVLKITRINMIMAIYQSEEEAICSKTSV